MSGLNTPKERRVFLQENAPSAWCEESSEICGGCRALDLLLVPVHTILRVTSNDSEKRAGRQPEDTANGGYDVIQANCSTEHTL
jgi:hypothetical protein